jgi:hypothetical protein
VGLSKLHKWLHYPSWINEHVPDHKFSIFKIFRAGQSAGRQDGKALGIQKGFEIGHEIGFYAGCTQIWRQVGAKNQDFISAKAEKAITALEDLVRSFPLDSPRVSLLKTYKVSLNAVLFILLSQSLHTLPHLHLAMLKCLQKEEETKNAKRRPKIKLIFLYLFIFQDESLLEKMDAIRGRYKTALSLLGLPDASLEPHQPHQLQRPTPDTLEF